MAEESCRSNDRYYSCSNSLVWPLLHWTVLLEVDIEISAEDGNVGVENAGDEVIGDCSSEIEAIPVLRVLALAVRTSQLKWMKRVATVKGDGIVEFEVPGDIKPSSSHLGTEVVHFEASGEEQDQVIDPKDQSPMQMVMLLVGTRGIWP